MISEAVKMIIVQFVIIAMLLVVLIIVIKNLKSYEFERKFADFSLLYDFKFLFKCVIKCDKNMEIKIPASKERNP